MAEEKKFTLAEAIEVNQAISNEIADVLDVAAIDVNDLYGDDSLLGIFGDDKGTTRVGRVFAHALTDRLLWARDSGLILTFDPEAEYVRVTHPPEDDLREKDNG